MKYYIKKYIQEVMEITIVYSVYTVLSDKTVDATKIMLVACIMGVITSLLNEYNEKYSQTLKNSFILNIGGWILKM